MCSAKARGQGHVGLFYETIHSKDRRHIDGLDGVSALAALFMVNKTFFLGSFPRYYIDLHSIFDSWKELLNFSQFNSNS